MDTQAYARRSTLEATFNPHTFLLALLLVALLGIALADTLVTGLHHAQAITQAGSTSLDVSWTD